MGFSRQEYWGGLPCPSPGNLPNPGIKPVSLTSPVLEGRFFTTGIPKWALPGKPMILDAHSQKHWRIKHKHIHVHSHTTEQSTMKQFCLELYYVFPDSSVGKESACNAGKQVESRGREDPPQKEMATHSSILAWRIPRTEEPSGLQFMGSQKVGHNWVTITFTYYVSCSLSFLLHSIEFLETRVWNLMGLNVRMWKHSSDVFCTPMLVHLALCIFGFYICGFIQLQIRNSPKTSREFQKVNMNLRYTTMINFAVHYIPMNYFI